MWAYIEGEEKKFYKDGYRGYKFNPLLDLRNWLIQLLAGKSPIVLNVCFEVKDREKPDVPVSFIDIQNGLFLDITVFDKDQSKYLKITGGGNT